MAQVKCWYVNDDGKVVEGIAEVPMLDSPFFKAMAKRIDGDEQGLLARYRAGEFD